MLKELGFGNIFSELDIFPEPLILESPGFSKNIVSKCFEPSF